MDDTGAELDACLRTMQAQSEEIRALRQMLGAAMELLEAREPTTAVTLKRNRGRPLKRTNANKAELLRAFEAMSADFRAAKPRTHKFSDLGVLRWWFRREWQRIGKTPPGGLLRWERKLKTLQNLLSDARHPIPEK